MDDFTDNSNHNDDNSHSSWCHPSCHKYITSSVILYTFGTNNNIFVCLQRPVSIMANIISQGL